MVVVDMELPMSCGDCPLWDGEWCLCNVDSSIPVDFNHRPERCPIKMVCEGCEKNLKKV